MHFKRVKHALPSDDDLLGLLFDGQTSNQSGNLFCCLPLSQLAETLLSRPDTRMDDFEEKMSRLRVQNENCTVDWFSRQITLVGLVNSHSVNVGIVNEPNDLVTEQLRVILRI